MKKCGTGKKLYPSESIAEDALVEAHIQFNYGVGQGPVGVYQCDECGHYHLTSQGKINERLAGMMRDGSLARLKEASRWMDRLKR
ncbi:MAG: hypothetical protein ACOYW3_13155 [Bacteroidota bacterium]